LSFELAAATRPLPGEQLNGDAFVVAVDSSRKLLRTSRDFERDGVSAFAASVSAGETVLVAAIDGVGHGPCAAECASMVLESILEHYTEPLSELARACHAAARSSRGTTLALARLFPESFQAEVLGIGDVRMELYSDPDVELDPSEGRRGSRSPWQTLTVMSGLVGYRIPSQLSPERVALPMGSCLVLATDGISGPLPSPGTGERRMEAADAFAARLLAESGRPHDDATAIVVCVT
jgi:hypothetical protein